MGTLGKHWKLSEKNKQNQRESKLGNKNGMYGRTPYNKGLTKETDERVKRTSETHLRLFAEGKEKKRFGKDNPFYNQKHTQESIKKIRDARAKQNFSWYNSSIEIKIQEFLKVLGIEHMTHFYINEIEHSYNCDIFIPSKKMVIECDGNYFHGNPELFPQERLNQKQIEQKERDTFRNKELREKGYKVLRLWENEIRDMTIDDLQNKMLQFGRTL